MMLIDILDEAKDDIINGGLFYRRQGGESLKGYFVDSIFAAIDTLAFSANAHPIRHGCHRLLADRFIPFTIALRMVL